MVNPKDQQKYWIIPLLNRQFRNAASVEQQYCYPLLEIIEKRWSASRCRKLEIFEILSTHIKPRLHLVFCQNSTTTAKTLNTLPLLFSRQKFYVWPKYGQLYAYFFKKWPNNRKITSDKKRFLNCVSCSNYKVSG